MAERDGLERLQLLLRPALEGRLSEREHRELQDVLRSDPEARRTYLRYCQMHAMLAEEDATLGLLEEGTETGKLLELPIDAPAEDEASVDDSLPRRTAAHRPQHVPSVTHWKWRRFPRPAAIALAGAAAGMAAALVLGLFSVAPHGSPGVADSGIGATDSLTIASGPSQLVRQAELADGSIVQLAPKSSLALQYTKSERTLELEDGEAHFSVARDEHRPFVVAVGDMRVRAVGTAFNVRRAAGRVVVTVMEGKVHVARPIDPEAPGAEGAIVAAGSQVVWDLGERPRGPLIAAVNPSRALAWREGRLEYVREPLRAVVADLNRYAERPVVIGENGLEHLHVTAVVFTNATEAWLAGLPESLPVRVEFQTDRTVLFAAEAAKVPG